MIPRRFFWLFDGLTILASFLASYCLFPHLGVIFGPSGFMRSEGLDEILKPEVWSGSVPAITELLWMVLAIMPTTILALGILGNHRPLLNQSRTRILVGGTTAPFFGLSVLTVFLFVFKSWEWGRAFAFSLVAISGVSLSGYRLMLRKYVALQEQAGRYAQNVLVVGLPESVRALAKYFRQFVSDRNYRLIGYLRIPSAPGTCQVLQPDVDSDVVSELGSVYDLPKLLVAQPINEVVAIHPVTEGRWLSQVIDCCDHLGIGLRILPEVLLQRGPNELARLYPYNPLRLPSLILRPPQWDADALFVKRLFDLFVAGLLLLILSPLLLVIAVIIKLNAPKLTVFYRWPVVGKHGKEFTGYKFRTMVPNADALKESLLSRNEMKGPVFKIKDDPRITRIGRFLRKYSLDELPQLWSVLKGDMSMVGPRPAGKHELPRYEFWHKRKLSILPGITCLWQVSGRNKVVDFDEWVRMDFEYIEHWSLWLDFKILARTAWVVVSGTGY